MPTSYGLSHSTCSLPRSACTMGDFSFAPSANSAPCAPAQPEPQSSVTRDAAFSSAARRSSSLSAGRTSDGPGSKPPTLGAGASTACCSDGSPEMTITATPPLPTAARIPASSPQGIGDAVQAVAHHAIYPLDADGREGFGELICNGLHVPRTSSMSLGSRTAS